MGLAGSLVFARIQETPRSPTTARGVQFRALLSDSRFRRFLVGVLFLQCSASMAGPFVVIYMVRVLEANSAHIGLLATSDAFAALGGQLLMTMLIRRWPSRRLFAAALWCTPVVPLLWLGIDEPWQALLPSVVSGVAWAVWHLAAFNLLLEYAQADRIPEYASAYQLTALGAAFLGPFAGSLLIPHIGIAGVFLASAAGRLLAIPLFIAPIPNARLRGWAAGLTLPPVRAATAAQWDVRVGLATASAQLL